MSGQAEGVVATLREFLGDRLTTNASLRERGCLTPRQRAVALRQQALASALIRCALRDSTCRCATLRFCRPVCTVASC